MSINIEIQIPTELLGLAARLEDQSGIWRDFKEYRSQVFRDQIADQVDPYGEPLPPLSAAYAKQKAKQYPGEPIRRRTGQTVNSYRADVLPNGLEESVRSPWAGHMQKGTKRMPARPYLPEYLTEADRRQLEDLAIKAILKS